jgi:DNA-binding NtrC family response regulator
LIEGASVMVLAEDASLRRSLAREIVERHAEALTAADLETCVSLLLTRGVDVVVLDASLPPGASALIERLRTIDDQIEIVLALREERADDVLRSLGPIDRQHRLDVVILPAPSPLCWNVAISRAIQRRRLERTIAVLEEQHAHLSSSEEMVGASAVMRDLRKRVSMIASATSPVLIEGERGTGKELLARQIHEGSARSSAPFVTVSCSAIAPDHLSDELFGTDKAVGAIARASRGALFLDEIEHMGLEAQRRLVGWLANPRDEGSRRGDEPRLMISTRVDLRKRVKSGDFREDLFYRLNVIPLRIPALRQRKDDIPLLAHTFLRRHASRQSKDVQRIGIEAMRKIRSHPWPGNVRQLEASIERAVVMARGETIVPGDLLLDEELDNERTTRRRARHEADDDEIARTRGSSANDLPATDETDWTAMPYAQAKDHVMAAFHTRYIDNLAARVGTNVSEAARQAGLDRSNFRRILKAAGKSNRFVVAKGALEPARTVDELLAPIADDSEEHEG